MLKWQKINAQNKIQISYLILIVWLDVCGFYIMIKKRRRKWTCLATQFIQKYLLIDQFSLTHSCFVFFFRFYFRLPATESSKWIYFPRSTCMCFSFYYYFIFIKCESYDSKRDWKAWSVETSRILNAPFEALCF